MVYLSIRSIHSSRTLYSHKIFRELFNGGSQCLSPFGHYSFTLIFAIVFFITF